MGVKWLAYLLTSNEYSTTSSCLCIPRVLKSVVSLSPHSGCASITCQCQEYRGESDRLPTLKEFTVWQRMKPTYYERKKKW